jgi:hypothetical protein
MKSIDLINGIDFLGILKLGLPGLVFLLSLLSCWLLAVEQKRPDAREAVLKTIQKYIYINVAFVVLTAVTPIAESNMFPKIQTFTVKATTQTGVQKGVAAVCSGVNYANRYLLLRNNGIGNSKGLVQVQAKSVIPCVAGESLITISPVDANLLGWNAGVNNGEVVIAAAQPGFMFVCGGAKCSK